MPASYKLGPSNVRGTNRRHPCARFLRRGGVAWVCPAASSIASAPSSGTARGSSSPGSRLGSLRHVYGLVRTQYGQLESLQPSADSGSADRQHPVQDFEIRTSNSHSVLASDSARKIKRADRWDLICALAEQSTDCAVGSRMCSRRSGARSSSESLGCACQLAVGPAFDSLARQ